MRSAVEPSKYPSEIAIREPIDARFAGACPTNVAYRFPVDRRLNFVNRTPITCPAGKG
jgi:hypothetical protein